MIEPSQLSKVVPFMWHHRCFGICATLLAGLLTTLLLAGCDLGVGQASPTSFPTVPSVLVSSVMQNPGGIAAGYGKLTIMALDPSHGSVRWRYQTDWHPYQLVGAPLEADGIIFTVSDPVPSTKVCSPLQGNLVALRESDGRQLWSVPVGFLPTPPVVTSGVVYTSALQFDECATPRSHQETRSYYALRAGDGHQLWRTDLTQDTTDANPDDSIGLYSSLQLVDGTLVDTAETGASESGDRVGHLFAFDATSGKLRWKNTFFSDIRISSGPIADGLLYVMASPRDEPLEWTAYRTSDGQQVWQVSGGYSGRFLVTGGVIYADAMYEAATSTPQQRVFDTKVVALDAHTGQQLWQVTADSNDRNGLDALLGVRNNTVYVQTGPSALTVKAEGHWRLEGVDSQSGHVRWSVPLQWLLGSVLLTDATLYGYSTDLPGHVLALNPADGHMLWRTPIDSGQNGGEGGHRSLVLGNDALYAASETGTLTAVRAQDGAVLWTARIEGSGTAQIEGSVAGVTVVV